MSTELTIVDSSAVTVPTTVHPLAQQYPGMQLSANASIEEVEAFVIAVTQYTGAETQNVQPFLSIKHPVTKEKIEQKLEVWGCVAFTKEMIDQQTGEVRPAIGVIFKIRQGALEAAFEEGAASLIDPVYLSFTSVAAWNFVKKNILPLRPMGDWGRPLGIVVEQRQLQVGHTYNFRVVAL